MYAVHAKKGKTCSCFYWQGSKARNRRNALPCYAHPILLSSLDETHLHTYKRAQQALMEWPISTWPHVLLAYTQCFVRRWAWQLWGLWCCPSALSLQRNYNVFKQSLHSFRLITTSPLSSNTVCVASLPQLRQDGFSLYGWGMIGFASISFSMVAIAERGI